ncbi:hypothetical protein UNDKW_3825 [Undibacterium sp. KW1]|uniref:tetratricopeptide repeat protein n=1 Tax=Undibacterium sp. KW1 TaxID=2058624 RepID=UPI001331EFD6|nr:tetratricopeptide repeat protein [Undibacterium sp. KW1]BBB62098.1 hypothetical protein UNDKW_3825 [Undibacterium sp. KW1]
MDIPEKTHELIKEICAEGNVFVEMGEFQDAHKNYIEALNLVPEPKQDYAATTWILAALGDTYFLVQDYAQAQQVFADAMHCVGAIGNPFLHLRNGQIAFELGDTARAADELCRAYMGAGKEIFERDDSKYFEFLKAKISPPANGAW